MAIEVPGTHFEGEVAQKVFIVEDGKVLMCRGVGFDDFDLPGGRLHKGELPREGLIREIREELGIGITLREAFHFHVAMKTYSGIPRYVVVFRAERSDMSEEIKPAEDEIAEVRFVGKEDAKALRTWDIWRELLNGHFTGKH